MILEIVNSSKKEKTDSWILREYALKWKKDSGIVKKKNKNKMQHAARASESRRTKRCLNEVKVLTSNRRSRKQQQKVKVKGEREPQ